MMPQRLSLTALLVDDYDRAIAYYVGKLGFDLREDTLLSQDKRWVVVAPPGSDSALLLARAANDRQKCAIGDQSGGGSSCFWKRTILFAIMRFMSRAAFISSKRRVRKSMEPSRSSRTFTAIAGI
jgi:catechol 2,3-dioxygenase-like lactoylglutathione lyase family enzyme